MPQDPRSQYWSARIAAAHDHLATRVTGTVVDVGCGDGRALPLYRAAGARGVIGLDDDHDVVERARAAHATELVEVVEAELTDLPLVNDTYDTVLSTHVLEHVDDGELFLSELARITRRGGLVGVVTPNVTTVLPADADGRSHPDHVRGSSPASLGAVMAAAGLEVTELEGLAHAPDLAERLAALGPRALPGLAARPWPADLATAVGAVTRDDFVVTRDLDACLDLVAWATPA